jgi:hypothetical protein
MRLNVFELFVGSGLFVVGEVSPAEILIELFPTAAKFTYERFFSKARPSFGDHTTAMIRRPFSSGGVMTLRKGSLAPSS